MSRYRARGAFATLALASTVFVAVVLAGTFGLAPLSHVTVDPGAPRGGLGLTPPFGVLNVDVNEPPQQVIDPRSDAEQDGRDPSPTGSDDGDTLPGPRSIQPGGVLDPFVPGGSPRGPGPLPPQPGPRTPDPLPPGPIPPRPLPPRPLPPRPGPPGGTPPEVPPFSPPPAPPAPEEPGPLPPQPNPPRPPEPAPPAPWDPGPGDPGSPAPEPPVNEPDPPPRPPKYVTAESTKIVIVRRPAAGGKQAASVEAATPVDEDPVTASGGDFDEADRLGRRSRPQNNDKHRKDEPAAKASGSSPGRDSVVIITSPKQDGHDQPRHKSNGPRYRPPPPARQTHPTDPAKWADAQPHPRHVEKQAAAEAPADPPAGHPVKVEAANGRTPDQSSPGNSGAADKPNKDSAADVRRQPGPPHDQAPEMPAQLPAATEPPRPQVPADDPSNARGKGPRHKAGVEFPLPPPARDGSDHREGSDHNSAPKSKGHGRAK